jgi:hypothetical protein
MATQFTFYHQKRFDGGIRTGVELPTGEEWQHFEPGTDADSEPALLWYIDIVGRGDGVPQDIAQVVQDLRDHHCDVQRVLNEAADRLSAGVDHSGWPYRVDFPKCWEGVNLTISGGAIRRLEALEIADTLRDVSNRWLNLLGSVAPEPVMA